MTTRGAPLDELIDAVRAFRTAVGESRLPLALPTADAARDTAATVLAQIDDYLLPRLQRLDAPLLVGVGGPTGAGKSTTVNSLIRAPASTAGVLRPTTRAPVLVCHPADSGWFRSGSLLGGLTRTSGRSAGDDDLHLVTAPAMPAGCALLDTPDIDSVVASNRDRAMKLLASADLWLFVTTAARYADAVPWELLQTARERGTTVALLLNRLPAEGADEITAQVTELLAARGLAGAPLFVVPETRVDGQGMLPEHLINPLREWFDALAADEHSRGGVVRQTLDGALAALPPAAETFAAAVDDQLNVADTLAEQVGVAYGNARATVEYGVRDGTLLRGEAQPRWREFVDSGQWRHGRLAGAGRGRPRLPFPTRSQAARELVAAIQAGLASLVRSAIVDAAEQAYQVWRDHPAGAPLLTSEPQRATLADADDQASRLAHQWRRDTLALAEAEVGSGRGRAAVQATVTGALVLAVAVAGEAGGDPVPAGQHVLAAARGDQTLRTLAGKAREDLLTRVAALLDGEAARYLERLAGESFDGDLASRVREAGAAVERARQAAGLRAPLSDPPLSDPPPSDPPPSGPPAAGAPASERAAR